MRRFRNTSGPVVVLAVAFGLVMGLVFAGAWPSKPLHAVATHGQENFAICTGMVDTDVEAIYFLDYITGDLRAAVMNTRTGKFGGFFNGNVVADFNTGANKNPKYLIVTGLCNLPRGRQNFQPAAALVYVAEATSGQVACYTIPWNSAVAAQGKSQQGQFVGLDKQTFRAPVLRDLPANK